MLTLKDVNTNKTWKFENKTDARPPVYGGFLITQNRTRCTKRTLETMKVLSFK